MASEDPPEYAVIDLKMPGDSGLVLVRKLNELDPATRIVVLTGYASISTAVEAIKLGATHYLAKPVDADEVVSAFNKAEGDADISISNNPLTVERLEWEHIQRVFAEHAGNVSATARALNMHRRTLQRKLSKRAPRSENGFTLIELIVIIMLLGIPTVTALPRFVDIRASVTSTSGSHNMRPASAVLTHRPATLCHIPQNIPSA
jgi:two-component system response regulator RegA